MGIGNQMQNHKIETNSELIYEDGIIWSTLIFIKIIGSDTLWFPLPPSEVLQIFKLVVCLQNINNYKFKWVIVFRWSENKSEKLL